MINAYLYYVQQHGTNKLICSLTGIVIPCVLTRTKPIKKNSGEEFYLFSCFRFCRLSLMAFSLEMITMTKASNSFVHFLH